MSEAKIEIVGKRDIWHSAKKIAGWGGIGRGRMGCGFAADSLENDAGRHLRRECDAPPISLAGSQYIWHAAVS